MPNYLNETFWKDKFYLTPLDIDQLHEYFMKRNEPLSTDEIGETIVRNLIERGETKPNILIYSPERKYNVNEEILILQKTANRYALITGIDRNRSTYISSKEIAYDMIRVQFLDDSDNARYVSNCPDFPLRFQAETQENEYDSKFTTPGQIFTQFKDYVLPKVTHSLNFDKRFINFKDEWFLKDSIVGFGQEELDGIYSMIALQRQVPLENVLRERFNIRRNHKDFKSTAFSLNCALRDDHKRRFVYLESEDKEVIWDLSPPPKEVSLTITNEALFLGFIILTSELEKMLVFFGIDSDVTFVSYANYEIKGTLNRSERRISGNDIKSWFKDNQIVEKEKIYIKCPEKYCGPLRLYTLHQKRKEWEGEEVEPLTERIYLREKIYQILKSENKFLHYKQIKEEIVDRTDKEAKLSSIEETLSNSSHLFKRHLTIRGLWGLAEWSERSQEIDRISLVLAISEEDWVYRILKNISRPLSTKELSTEIASLFVINSQDLVETSFIDPKDNRLVKFSNGLWGLREWIEEWEEEVKKIEVLLKAVIDQRERIERIRIEEDSNNKRLLFLENMEREQSSAVTQLATEIAVAEQELSKIQEQITENGMEFREIKNVIDRLMINIESLRYKNKIVTSIYLLSILGLIAACIWNSNAMILLFSFSFLFFAGYGLSNYMRQIKLRNSLSTKVQERSRFGRELVKLRKGESISKDMLNQKSAMIDQEKRELERKRLEILERKKNIQKLEQLESELNQSVSKYNAGELVSKKEEIVARLEAVL